MSQNYEKAKKKGKATEAQYNYLASHGFDMTGIVRYQVAQQKHFAKKKKEDLFLKAENGDW